MLIEKTLSDREIYSRLRKYLPRSMAGDNFASEVVAGLYNLSQSKNPEIYYNALDDSLSDISHNDNLALGESLDTFIRAKYSEGSALDEFFDLFKGSPVSAGEEKYAFNQFCLNNGLNPENIMLFPIVGNSMINANIFEGDTAIVDVSRIPGNGEIGAVHINNKYFIKRIGGVGGRLKLISENPDYKPYLVGPEDDFKYIGLVTNLIKKMY